MAFRYSTLVASPNEQSPLWKRRSQPELSNELSNANIVEQVPLSEVVSSRLSSMPEHGKLHDFLHQMSSRRRRSQPFALQTSKRGGSSKALARRGSAQGDDALRSPQRAQLTRSTSMDTVVLLVNSFDEEEEVCRTTTYRHSEKKSKRRSRRINLLSRKPAERATLS